jgi:hypothetical protein
MALVIRGDEVEVEADDVIGLSSDRISHLIIDPSLLEVYNQLPSSEATAAVTGPR